MSADGEDPLVRQVELYGAPVGETVRRVTSTLGLSQAAVARTIGVSPPMLSQLVSGQRVKFGNARALQRLQSLLVVADEVERGLAHEAVAERVAAISREDSTTLTTDRSLSVPSDLPAAFGGLLRAVASGRDLAAAADRLERDFPGLAEVLRVYGSGSREEAATHFRKVAHLL